MYTQQAADCRGKTAQRPLHNYVGSGGVPICSKLGGAPAATREPVTSGRDRMYEFHTCLHVLKWLPTQQILELR